MARNETTLMDMITRRAYDEARLQADHEVARLDLDIKAKIAQIGVAEFFVPIYELTQAVRERRIDALVHARLQALADQLMAPAKNTETIKVELDTGPLLDLIGQIMRNTQRTADHLDSVTEGGNAMRVQA